MLQPCSIMLGQSSCTHLPKSLTSIYTRWKHWGKASFKKEHRSQHAFPVRCDSAIVTWHCSTLFFSFWHFPQHTALEMSVWASFGPHMFLPSNTAGHRLCSGYYKPSQEACHIWPDVMQYRPFMQGSLIGLKWFIWSVSNHINRRRIIRASLSSHLFMSFL